MERRVCCTRKPCLFPILLAVAGVVLLLCCLPMWAVFALVGVGLIVLAIALLLHRG